MTPSKTRTGARQCCYDEPLPAEELYVSIVQFCLNINQSVLSKNNLSILKMSVTKVQWHH